MADINGICVIPPDKVLEVLKQAESIQAKEEALIELIKRGENPMMVQEKGGYENMLKK